MTDRSLPPTVPDRPQPANLDRLSAVEAADLLLFELARGSAPTLILEPTERRHVVRREGSRGSAEVATLDAALGDAVAARLAMVARLVPGEPMVQVARLRVGLGTDERAAAVEVLLAVRTTPGGLSVELHRLGSAESERAPAVVRAPGRTFDGWNVGQYRVVGELGQGGMGVVYRAEHVLLQKPVALKVLHPEVARDPVVASQFVVEARAACRARHPGIVDVTDFGVLADGRAYLVMELVEAPTLATILAEGPVEAPRALVMGREIATALAAASARGVVHRDLTPANIFVLSGDRVKVGDFGLARIVGSSEASSPDSDGTVVGTAAYMSPEQGTGQRVDTRSDIYSLGCVLFRMVTGRVPFPAASLLEVIEQHAAAPVPDIESPLGPVPESVARIIQRAMAKKKEERYQTFDEMLLDLGSATQTLARGDWRRWLSQ